MNDWRGVPIEVGCHVLYVSRSGSHVSLHEGVVLEVTTKHLWGGPQPALVVNQVNSSGFGNVTGRPSTLTALKHVTVIAKAPAKED